jgi:hypothetical protein
MPKTFIDTFIEHRNGGAAIDMQKRLEEVIKGVCETGLVGKLTLTYRSPSQRNSSKWKRKKSCF